MVKITPIDVNGMPVDDRVPPLMLKRHEHWLLNVLLVVLAETRESMTAKQLFQYDPQIPSWMDEPRALSQKLKFWAGKPEFPIGVYSNHNTLGLKEFALKEWFVQSNLDVAEHGEVMVSGHVNYDFLGGDGCLDISERVYHTYPALQSDDNRYFNGNVYRTRVVATPEEQCDNYCPPNCIGPRCTCW